MFIRVLIFSLFSFSLSHVSPVNAQPDLTITTGKTVADTGAPGYRFKRLTFQIPDATPSGEAQHYRINLAIPTTTAPANGFPLLIMLDGNAALMEVDAELLGKFGASERPPVLAFLAHDNDLRIDGNARAYDYTPVVSQTDLTEREQRPGREYGGADKFLAFIIDTAIPAIAKSAPVDQQNLGLWGHSYGGLFVLHTLYTHPESFHFYAPVDPSLWWGNGYILSEEKTFTQKRADLSNKVLFTLTGTGNNEKKRPHPNRDVATIAAVYKAREAVPQGEAKNMINR